MIKQIFIVNGKPTAGKDTFVEMCLLKTKGFNLSSISPIKELAYNIGWDGIKNSRSRKFLSDLKILTTKFNNYPMLYLKKKLKEINKKEFNSIVFIMMREPEEIEKFIKEVDFDIKTVLIRRDSNTTTISNSADANVENMRYDYIISNDEDLDSLDKKATNFLSYISSNIKEEKPTIFF